MVLWITQCFKVNYNIHQCSPLFNFIILTLKPSLSVATKLVIFWGPLATANWSPVGEIQNTLGVSSTGTISTYCIKEINKCWSIYYMSHDSESVSCDNESILHSKSSITQQWVYRSCDNEYI